MVDLRLPDSEVELFVLDNRFSGSVSLTWAMFDALKSAGKVQEGEPAFMTMAGRHRSVRRGRLSTVSMGEFDHKDLEVVSPDESSRSGLAFLDVTR